MEYMSSLLPIEYSIPHVYFIADVCFAFSRSIPSFSVVHDPMIHDENHVVFVIGSFVVLGGEKEMNQKNSRV